MSRVMYFLPCGRQGPHTYLTEPTSTDWKQRQEMKVVGRYFCGIKVFFFLLLLLLVVWSAEGDYPPKLWKILNDRWSSMNNYALQLNYMKLRNYGGLSPLTFNMVVYLNRTSKYNALAWIWGIPNQYKNRVKWTHDEKIGRQLDCLYFCMWLMVKAYGCEFTPTIISQIQRSWFVYIENHNLINVQCKNAYEPPSYIGLW